MTTPTAPPTPPSPGGPTQVGVTGLATMGQNLARNIASRGFSVAVHNRSPEKTHDLVADHGAEGAFVPSDDLAGFVSSMTSPRVIVIMVKAGKPVDDVIAQLVPLLAPGDVIVDGGNSFWSDSVRREGALAQQGLRFVGCGVSGGEEGALKGPSLMPGCTPEAYAIVEPVLHAIAAVVDGEPCVTHLGTGGAGHYVKMVHNGIEYGDMQLIAEAYDLLHRGAGLTNDQLADTFGDWNSGDLDSFLIEITAQTFRRRADPGQQEGDGWLVDHVLDSAGQKGTGRQTSSEALELSVPVTTITEAVFARFLSAQRAERIAASEMLPGPLPGVAQAKDPATFVAAVRDALYASKVVAYAQGFAHLRAAAAVHGWSLDLGEVARIWRGGCIIRARFLNRIRDAYAENPDLANLLLAPYFTEAVGQAQDGWRRVVTEAVRLGIPTPAFSSALAYYDGYRSARLPANLIQAQRDLFGAHTYQRLDRDGTFHSDWATVHQPEGAEGRVD